MRRLVAAIVVIVVLTLGGTRFAESREPSYLILQAPARAHRGHPYYPGRGYTVRPQAYAYGWFGVQPRRHLRRSTGYYENYIQWTKQ